MHTTDAAHQRSRGCKKLPSRREGGLPCSASGCSTGSVAWQSTGRSSRWLPAGVAGCSWRATCLPDSLLRVYPSRHATWPSHVGGDAAHAGLWSSEQRRNLVVGTCAFVPPPSGTLRRRPVGTTAIIGVKIDQCQISRIHNRTHENNSEKGSAPPGRWTGSRSVAGRRGRTAAVAVRRVVLASWAACARTGCGPPRPRSRPDARSWSPSHLLLRSSSRRSAENELKRKLNYAFTYQVSVSKSRMITSHGQVRACNNDQVARST